MTDYYVNHSTGSDGNDGSTAALAFKDIRFAMRNLSANDRLFLNGSTPSDPFRSNQEMTITTASAQVLFDTVATFTGLGDSYQVIWMSRDMKEPMELLPTPDMDAYFSGGAYYGLTANGTAPTKETTITQGAASSKFSRAAGISGYYITNLELSSEQAMQLKIRHIAGSNTGNLRYRLRNITDGTGWHPGGWAADSYENIANNYPGQTPVADDFETLTIDIDAIGGTPGNKRIDLYVDCASGNTNGFYVDYISLKKVNAWTEVQIDGENNVYQLKDNEVEMLWTCSEAEWTASGINALRQQGGKHGTDEHGGLATFADVLTTPNSWAWEAHALRVNLGSDTLANTHIEAWHNDSVSKTVSSDDVELNNLHFGGGNNSINFVSDITGEKQKYTHGYFGVGFSSGTGTDITDIEVAHCMKDGCTISGAGIIATFRSVNLHDCGDEGMQAISGGKMVVRGGAATRCGSSDYAGTAAFGTESANSAFDIKGVTVWDCDQYGVNETSGTPANSSITDSILYGNNTGGYGGGVDINLSVVGSFGTIERIHYGTQGDNVGMTSGVAGNLELTATPFSTAPQLLSTASAVGAATKWWTGPNPVGGDGEPFSDMQTDLGGIQTTLYKLHPANQ